MVIDSSALIAIALEEPEAERLLGFIRQASPCKISAATFLETGMVLKRDATGKHMAAFEKLIRALGLSIIPVTEEQARTALNAFDRYGKGRGHPAGLNFGDCFSYALAKVSGEPLLFKGEDFIHTDIQAVKA
jgi:ribonuclease VapC